MTNDITGIVSQLTEPTVGTADLRAQARGSLPKSTLSL
jgi:hypothetical protein